MRTHTQQYGRSQYHTQLAKLSFDEIFDLAAGVSVFLFYTRYNRGIKYNLDTYLDLLDYQVNICLYRDIDTQVKGETQTQPETNRMGESKDAITDTHNVRPQTQTHTKPQPNPSLTLTQPASPPPHPHA